MKLMKDMDTSSFSKSQTKLIKRTSILAPYNILQEILNFYECPESCGAQCCKKSDIPLMVNDKQRISQKGQGYRSIIKEQTKIVQSVVDGEDITNEVFKEKPCPFLNKNRCCIYKFKPIICTLFPFRVVNKPKSIVEIVACPMGKNIVTDYTAFQLFMAFANKENPELIPSVVNGAAKIMNGIIENGCLNFETSPVMNIEDLETLRYFLLYLKTETIESRMARRGSLLSLVNLPMDV